MTQKNILNSFEANTEQTRMNEIVVLWEFLCGQF